MSAEALKALNDSKAKIQAEITKKQQEIDTLKADLKKIDKALKALEQ